MSSYENIMPECWSDDVRMGALFSPFRKRNVNPVDWESKLKFWESLIEKWCGCNKQSKVSLQLLKKVFQRKGTMPLCIETVIEEMIRDGTLVLYSDFVQLPPQETWMTWVVNLVVKRPAVWTFNKIKETLVALTDGDASEYVHIPTVKIQADELLSALLDKDRNKLWDVKELCMLTGHVPEVSEELVLASHWLQRENKAAMCMHPDGGPVLVKIAGARVKTARVTEVDLGVYNLRCSEKTLTRHIEQLEEEQEAALNQARKYMVRNMKQMAKSCLRKRKQLDQCVEKRISALENVRLLLSRLQDTESDAQVLEAYRTGVSALKLTFSEAGLTEDTAATAVLQVQEVLDVHEEINAALSQPICSSMEADLEEELADLLDNANNGPPSSQFPGSGMTSPQKDSGVQKEEGRSSIVLPDVPSHEPLSLAGLQLPA